MPAPRTTSIPPGTATLVAQGRHAGQPGIPILRPATVIGSRAKSHVHLVSSSISNTHAVIIKTERGHYVRDLASRTGVFVNGTQVREADLKDGDLLAVGNFIFQFQDGKGRAPRTRATPADAKQSPAAQFDVAGSPQPVPVTGRTMLIGRRENCDISLIEESVSTTHALLFEMDGRWFLRDMSSRTGTHVEGKPIHQEEIHFGDEILIGDTKMRLSPAGAPSPDDVDELEDLIGTAPLLTADADEADALEPIAATQSVARSSAAAKTVLPPPPATDDDLLTEEDAHEGPVTLAPAVADVGNSFAAPLVGSEAKTPEPVELPEPFEPVDSLDLSAETPADEPIAIESAIEPEKTVEAEPVKPVPPIVPIGSGMPTPMGVMEAERRPAPAEPAKPTPEPIEDLIDLEKEIDLSTDPDVSGPAETTTIKLSSEETQQKPALSDRVVDAIPSPEAPAASGVPDSATSKTSDTTHDWKAHTSDHVAEGLDELSTSATDDIEVDLDARGGWRRRDVPPIEEPVAKAPAVTETPKAEVTKPQTPRAAEPSVAVAPPEPAAAEAAEPEPADVLAESEASEPVAEIPPQAIAPTEEETAEAPQPVVELETIDFSSLSLPIETEAKEEPAAIEEPEAIAASEPILDLGLASPVVAELPPAPLIAPDAIPLETSKSKRARKPVKPKAETPPKPEKPVKAPRKGRAKKSALVEPALATEVPAVETPVVEETPAVSRPIIEDFASPISADPLEHQPIDAVESGTTEILDNTEPTPTSALNLDDLAAGESEFTPIGPVVSPAAEAMTDSAFGRQVNEFVADAPEPIVEDASVEDVSAVEKISTDDTPDILEPEPEPEVAADLEPLDLSSLEPVETDEAPSSDYVVDVSHTADFLPADVTVTSTDEIDLSATPEVVAEPERPKNALEQIAASISPEALDEFAADQPDSPTVEKIEPEVPSISEPETPADAALSSPQRAEKPDSDHWPMPNESDLLLPDDEPTFGGVDEGRDKASFIGGMPLPLAGGLDVLELDKPAAVAAPAAGPELTPPPTPAPEESLTPVTNDVPTEEGPTPDLDLQGLDLSDLEPAAENARVPESVSIETPAATAEAAPIEPPATVAPAVIAPVAPPTVPPAPVAPVAEKPAEPAKPTNKIPPRPKMARRGEPLFAKTPFDFKPDDTHAGQPAIPPFTGPEPATFGRVTTAFDGLAMPPVREADVFSNTFEHGRGPAAGTQNGAGPNGNGNSSGKTVRPHVPPAPGQSSQKSQEGTLGLIPETIDYATPAKPAQVRLAKPNRPGFRPPVAPVEIPRPAARKRRLSIRWLLPAMLICMLGSAWGIYQFVKVVTPIDGYVTYENLDKLVPAKRTAIEAEQTRLASSSDIRKQAEITLNSVHGALSPGFIGSGAEATIDFSRNVSIFFPKDSNRMRVKLQSTDPSDDFYRMQALLKAIEIANVTSMNDNASRLKQAAQKSRDDMEKNERAITDLETRIKEARRAGDERPSDTEVADLEAKGQQLENDLAAATTAVRDAKSELEKLQSPRVGPVSVQKTIGQDDPQISQWTEQLSKLTTSRDSAATAQAERAKAAKTALDTAMAELTTQITSAKDLAKASPELTAYVESASKLQDWARRLNDSLDDRQRRQTNTLAELLRSFREKRDTRIASAIQSDPALRTLDEEMSLTRRQLSVARDEKDTDKIVSFEGRLNDLAAERQKRLHDVLGDDPYADNIAKLEAELAASQKQTAEDRKTTEALLTELQQALTSATPAMDKLPEEQKSLAQRLADASKKLNDAQKAYASEIDAGAVAASGSIAATPPAGTTPDAAPGPETAASAIATTDVKAVDSQIADLNAKIEARKTELAEAAQAKLSARAAEERSQQIAAKQAQVADMQRKADEISESALANAVAVRKAKAAITAAREYGNSIIEMQKDRDKLALSRSTLADDYKTAQAIADSAVTVLKVTSDNVSVGRSDDPRMTYIAISIAVIAMLFVGLILWSMSGRQDPVIYYSATDAPANTAEMPTDLPPAEDKKADEPTVSV